MTTVPPIFHKLPIAGFRACSLVDYPGCIAAVLFLRGCDFRCPWCHNPSLVNTARYLPLPEPESIWERLVERRGRLDGVVISGGEPTLHAELPELIAALRSLDYAIKLDTHGGHPAALERLLTTGQVDYVAMDVKAGPAGYSEAIGRRAPVEKISRSLTLLRECGIPYELRVTVTPALLRPGGDLPGLHDWLAGAPRVALQAFRPGDTLRPGYGADDPKISPDDLRTVRAFLAPVVREILLRD